MACLHYSCEKTLRVIRLVWLAATDAVVHEDYLQLFQSDFKDVQSCLPCSENCFIHKALEETKERSLLSLLFVRLLSNYHAPDALFREVVSQASNDEIMVCMTIEEIFHLNSQARIQKQILDKFSQEFPSIAQINGSTTVFGSELENKKL